MLFSTGYARQIIDNRKKCTYFAGHLMAAMRIRQYSSKRIAQYGRSRATGDATGIRHRAIIHPVLLGHD